MESFMDRVVIFSGSPSWEIPVTLIKKMIETIANRSDFKIAAICLTEPQNYGMTLYNHLRSRALSSLQSFFTPSLPRRPLFPLPINLHRWARRFQFQVLSPPEGNINHPEFISRLQNEKGPMVAFSFYCLQKFSSQLLSVFDYTVNYHNGFLPEYRGLKATAWSVYNEEKYTGFTFHRMTKEFDEGAILVREGIPVNSSQQMLKLEEQKAITAAKYFPDVLEMVLNREPGIEQSGKGSYFSKETNLAKTKISDPSILSSVELMRRLRAFESLQLQIGNIWHQVTKCKQAPDQSGKVGRICFRTSDGVWMKAVRFDNLPYPIYLILKRIQRWSKRKYNSIERRVRKLLKRN
jgi:methionyl-tRNA formyltransferase